MSWNERQLLNRRFMSEMNQEDAFVTGYFFVWFQVPTKVGQVFNSLFKSDGIATGDAGDMSKILSALITGVPTIPDTTLNQTSMTGMGGPKWGVATNIDHPTDVGFKFRELASLPIVKIICSWFTMIRDPNAGTSLLIGDDYTKKNWGGRAVLGYTKPDGVTLEMATRFEGIFPTKYPTDLFTSDVSSVEPLEPDIQFHVDSIWSDMSAWKEGLQILKNFNQAQPYHKELTEPSIYRDNTGV